MRRLLPLITLLCCLSSGCELLQWVAPHQLWKLNRQPAMGGEDGYFSIPAQKKENDPNHQSSVAADSPLSPGK